MNEPQEILLIFQKNDHIKKRQNLSLTKKKQIVIRGRKMKSQRKQAPHDKKLNC